MIIFRYLAKEVFVTLMSLTAILMLIFLSNQFIQYLNRAASGSIPGIIILKLMILELPSLMGLLLPLGFYIALLLAYGRLYADNEMTVLQSSGYGNQQLLKHSYIMAGALALCVAFIVLWGGPYVAKERTRLLRTAGIKTLIQTIIPGRFQHFDNKVFYVQSMSRDHKIARGVFLAEQNKQDGKLTWNILWANEAELSDTKTFEDYLLLRNGQLYQGIPGQADYQIAQFAEYKYRLPHPDVFIDDDIRTSLSKNLWPLNNRDLKKAVELQWRVSIPLMVLTLTLVAVPLSRINPRGGKFANLLPAIIIYILYANGMFIARDALVSGKVPVWLGMWWLHLLVVLLGLILIWQRKVNLS